jgi:LL-diaminopimelate aminotransferase
MVQPTRLIRSIPKYVFWELDQRKRAHRASGRPLLDVGIGSPDQPVPAPVREALREAASRPELSGYPHFRGHPEFLRAMADYMVDRFGVHTEPERDYMAVAGSKEGLAEIILSICEPGDVVLVPEIYYPVYVRATQLASAEAVMVPFTANGLLDLEAIDPAHIARARVLIANYPCNPTTAIVDLAAMTRLVEFARANNILLVSDLAYAELAFDGFVPPSALEVPGAMECTVELHSASKSFNMAGSRVGVVVGNRDAINALDAYRSNVGYGAATLPQLGAAVAFRNYRELVKPIVAEYAARRDALVNAFHAHGWSVQSPRATMYLWLTVPEGYDDWGWVDHCLQAYNIVITPGIAFGEAGRGRFRISLVQPAAVLADVAKALAQR